ncbi:unnamed protein product [Symbiodinium microadriaticum]|nr:unnamed protein product [Symbiodinium microadriaticum]CAE7530425.1 unnamed protein product [Symbiodinium sp. KB8]
MSWKVGWGEPMNNEHAIASVCHRQLDPLSLVQLQEVLTYRWQSAHPEPRQPMRHAGLPGYPRHRLNATSSSPSLPGLPGLESSTQATRPSRARARAGTGSSKGLLPELETGASTAGALRAAASIPDFTKSSRGFERHDRLRDGRF